MIRRDYAPAERRIVIDIDRVASVAGQVIAAVIVTLFVAVLFAQFFGGVR